VVSPPCRISLYGDAFCHVGCVSNAFTALQVCVCACVCVCVCGAAGAAGCHAVQRDGWGRGGCHGPYIYIYKYTREITSHTWHPYCSPLENPFRHSPPDTRSQRSAETCAHKSRGEADAHARRRRVWIRGDRVFFPHALKPSHRGALERTKESAKRKQLFLFKCGHEC